MLCVEGPPCSFDVKCAPDPSRTLSQVFVKPQNQECQCIVETRYRDLSSTQRHVLAVVPEPSLLLPTGNLES